MKQYNVRYDKTINVVLALILPGFIVMPVIAATAIYFPGLPDWGIGTIIFLIMSAVLILAFNVVKRVSPHALLTLYNDRFVVDFEGKSIFHPGSFEVYMQDITRYDAARNRNGYYITFTTNVRPYKFNISSAGKTDEDISSFEELLVSISELMERHKADV